MTNAKHVLTDEELEMIGRLERGNAYSGTVDVYAPMPDMHSHQVEIHPLTNAPAHKRSFVPSRDESRKVGFEFSVAGSLGMQNEYRLRNLDFFFDLEVFSLRFYVHCEVTAELNIIEFTF